MVHTGLVKYNQYYY